jgi:hypothetical protein
MAADRLKLFRERAYYLPALPRTVEMFGGLIFLREPQFRGADALAPYLEDATLTGLSMEGLASWAVSEVIEVGRVAILVDFPAAPENLTRFQAEAAGFRAFARLYETESILSAEHKMVGGVRKLWRVRLLETRVEVDDEWKEREFRRVRVLELQEGIYTQTVWERGTNRAWSVVEQSQPARNGAPLDYIPIFFMNARDHDPQPVRPPLADLSDVSVSHINSSALREWGEMWTANPTPWFAGVQAAPTNESGESEVTYQIKLGSSEAILLDRDGRAGFQEFSGAGLASISDTLNRKEKHMAALGTRILLEDPRQAIAAETTRIQSAGQNSTLGRIATVASAALTSVLRELAQWAGVQDFRSVSYSLNKNFVPAGMSPEALKAYLAAVQQGQMSSQELYAALQAADVISGAKDYDLHLSELEEDEARLATRDPAAAPLAA